MSRAAASSKASGKIKGSSSITPAITKEIIPGKLNDNEWGGLLDEDDSAEFGRELVEEVCSAAFQIIHQNYLQKQLEPFTLKWAKDSLLQIVEWQFLERDEGEADLDNDAGWIQDAEPSPGMIDCWAQGAVPQEQLSSTPIPEEDEEAVDRLTTAPFDDEGGDAPLEQPDVEIDQEVKFVITDVEIIDASDQTGEGKETSPIEKKSKSPQRKPVRRHKGRLRTPKVAGMNETLDETERRLSSLETTESGLSETPDPLLLLLPSSCLTSMKIDDRVSAQVREGRPPANRDVLLDRGGNVAGMSKINPHNLPSHRVKTMFKVIDPSAEAAQAQVDALRKGKAPKGGSDVVPHPPVAGKMGRRKKGHLLTKKAAAVVNLPVQLIDSMVLAPGVTVKEGDRVKAGPKLGKKRLGLSNHLARATLNPVPSKATLPTIDVEELLGQNQPIIRPIQDNLSPVPPIMSQ